VEKGDHNDLPKSDRKGPSLMKERSLALSKTYEKRLKGDSLNPYRRRKGGCTGGPVRGAIEGEGKNMGRVSKTRVQKRRKKQAKKASTYRDSKRAKPLKWEKRTGRSERWPAVVQNGEQSLCERLMGCIKNREDRVEDAVYYFICVSRIFSISGERKRSKKKPRVTFLTWRYGRGV